MVVMTAGLLENVALASTVEPAHQNAHVPTTPAFAAVEEERGWLLVNMCVEMSSSSAL